MVANLEDFANPSEMPEYPGNGAFTILHAGLLNDSESWSRSPAGFFQAIRHIIQQRPAMADKLTLAFTLPLPEGHRRLANEMGLSGHIKELGNLPRADFRHLMKASDVLLAINYEDFATLIPGKIYDYWAAGGPPILLLNCQGAAQRLVEKHQLGFVVPPNDAQAIERVVLNVYQQREAGHPLRISTVGLEQYDRKTLSMKMAQTLSSLC